VLLVISIGATFIITVVVIVPVTIIITIMCYKHWCEKRERSNTKNDGTQKKSQFALMSQDIKMDTSPSYAVMDKDAIKMDANPSYVTMDKDTIKMDANPAYAATK